MNDVTGYFVRAICLDLFGDEIAAEFMLLAALNELKRSKLTVVNARYMLVRAEHEYLRSTGWEYLGNDKWLEPAGRPYNYGYDVRRTLFHNHAVNSQKYWERNILRRGEPENPRAIAS